jgi:hypothetical protein
MAYHEFAVVLTVTEDGLYTVVKPEFHVPLVRVVKVVFINLIDRLLIDTLLTVDDGFK